MGDNNNKNLVVIIFINMWLDFSWYDPGNNKKCFNSKTRLCSEISRKLKEIKCRKKEIELLESFIHDRIHTETGGTIFITGIPGTGKTFVVEHIVRWLKMFISNQKFGIVPIVNINCMKLQDPKIIYIKVYQDLCSITCKSKVYGYILEMKTSFSSPFKYDSKKALSILVSDQILRLIVLVIDEIDWLKNQQKILIDLINLAHKQYSRLV